MKTIPYREVLFSKYLQMVRETIANDGVIIYPTDTLYGIGGNFFSHRVIKKIDMIKKRGDEPYSVLVSGLPMLHRMVDNIPRVFYQIYRTLLPGKFTFLFKASDAIDRMLLKGKEKIGVRIPHVALMLKLVEILDVPLITTSVNRSGDSPLNDPYEIINQFYGTDEGKSISLLIDNGRLPASKGSTILDTSYLPIVCLREGDALHQLTEIGIEYRFLKNS